MNPSESPPTIDEFLASNLRGLMRLARLLTRHEADAEDLVQNALLRAVTKWHHVQRADNPAAYVRTMVVRTHLSAVRRRRLPQVPLLDHDLPLSGPDALATSTDRQSLLGALNSLGDTQRTVVVLRYWAGLSTDEIAQSTGLRPGTVRSALSRALVSLRSTTDLADFQETR